jgi:hypothetical protein
MLPPFPHFYAADTLIYRLSEIIGTEAGADNENFG